MEELNEFRDLIQRNNGTIEKEISIRMRSASVTFIAIDKVWGLTSHKTRSKLNI